MTTINIPRSIRAAEAKLTELGDLATATEWQRAAIVAAYVEPDTGRGGRRAADGLESATTFAARGVVGLTSSGSVLVYARAWLARFDRPRPGQKVTLPTDDWAPTRTGTDGYESVAGVESTLNRIIDKHGAGIVAQIAAERAPDEVAEIIVADPVSNHAVSNARHRVLDDRAGVEEMRERIRAREERMDAAIDESTTAMEHTGLSEHDGNIYLRAAAMWLAKAAAEFERNPILTGDQRTRNEAAMNRIDHYVAVLNGDGEWTGDDDAFLATLGIEGVTA